jgi:hypothetical protein
MFCLPFIKVNLYERGEECVRVADEIKQTMRQGVSRPITLICGVDVLCDVCPMCRDSRCQSELGDEEEVRKWDHIIMRELGVTDNTTLTAVEWRKMFQEKIPLTFCGRCKAKDYCEAGDRIK